MKLLLLVVIAIALVGGQKGKGDQGPPVLEDSDNSDIKIAYEDEVTEVTTEVTTTRGKAAARRNPMTTRARLQTRLRQYTCGVGSTLGVI